MTPFSFASCLSVTVTTIRHQVEVDCDMTSGTDVPTVACVILTCVVRERPAVPVEDEPALLPRLDLSSHLDEEAAARLLHDGDVVAGLDVVSGRLDVAAQVKVVLPHGQVAGQWTRLWTGVKNEMGETKNIFTPGSMNLHKSAKVEIQFTASNNLNQAC